MSRVGWSAAKSDKLPLARAYVRQCAVYMSATLNALVPHSVENLTELAGGPLAVTEHLVLLYEPAWINTVSMKVLATGLMHECMHAQLQHVRRGKAYADKKRANLAGDLFINGVMARQRHTIRVKGVNTNLSEVPMWEFPDWAAMPEHYGFPVGLTLHEYYQLLEKKDKKDKEDEGEGAGKGGEGAAGGGARQPAQGKIMCGCCGGVAGNPAAKSLEDSVDKNPKIGRSEANCQAVANETAKAIQRHMESEQGRGVETGNWGELVKLSTARFVVPWHTKLSRCLRGAIGNMRTGHTDYSMHRPSRRSYLRGIMLPGLISYDPIIWLVIDSSASMSTKMLSDAKRVCADVIQQTGVPYVYYLDADSSVKRDPLKIRARDLANLKILGRGGTDFRPVVGLADRHRPRPNLVVYITDGDGAAPETCPRGIQFIWCVVPAAHRRVPAEWGETILLEDASTPEK